MPCWYATRGEARDEWMDGNARARHSCGDHATVEQGRVSVELRLASGASGVQTGEGQVAPVAQHKEQERLHPWLLADQGLGAQRRETKEGGRRAAPRPAIGQRGRFWSVTIQVGEGAVGRDSRR
jgi:hypothetical protein